METPSREAGSKANLILPRLDSTIATNGGRGELLSEATRITDVTTGIRVVQVHACGVGTRYNVRCHQAAKVGQTNRSSYGFRPLTNVESGSRAEEPSCMNIEWEKCAFEVVSRELRTVLCTLQIVSHESRVRNMHESQFLWITCGENVSLIHPPQITSKDHVCTVHVWLADGKQMQMIDTMRRGGRKHGRTNHALSMTVE